MNSLRLLAPTLCLSGVAFLLFGIDASRTSTKRERSWVTLGTALVGLLGAAALIPALPPTGMISYGFGMLVWDGLSLFLTWIAILTVILVVLLSDRYVPYDGHPMALNFGLLLLATVGLLLVSSANDFLMIFLGIELVGVPSFILTGFLRGDRKSSEGAMKFFLIGAFASAMLAYGISILYGLIGSTSLVALKEHAGVLQIQLSLALVALFLIVVSFGFKIALVPFHLWVPDAFEGGPAPIAAFLSVAPKVAGVAIALRVFNLTLPSQSLAMTDALAVLAALTMTVGNLIGLQQSNAIRLLAYSSIAHMGYILLGIVATTLMGTSSVYLYGGIYLFMNLGAFAVVIAVANAMGSSDLSSFEGLAKREPVLSALLTLFLLGLAGIPPTAGFVAKFYVMSAAYDAGWTWLVILAAVNTVIAVGYYFKILHAMYLNPSPVTTPVAVPLPSRVALAVTSFVTLFAGIAPEWVLSTLRALASGLRLP